MAAVTGRPEAVSRLAARLQALAAVDLDELTGRFALQTRVDRKYLVTPSALEAMLDEVAAVVSALDIAGRRVFAYRSMYFDTPDLLCFRDHRQGRRRRFKVRTRYYLDSGDCLLEVKATSPRGETVKHRREHPAAAADRLTETGRAFAADALDGHPAVPALRPSLVTDYFRATLLDHAAGSRMTIDTGLRFAGPHRTIPAPPGTVVIETKSAGRPGSADSALHRLGIRPVSISKYCVGTALVHPGLPANPWNRVLRRHFSGS